MFNPQMTVEKMNAMTKSTIMEAIGIVITEIGEDFVMGTMPVDHRTHQPFGILHGGASVTLAETLGSIACQATINDQTQFCVGVTINSNHIRSVKSGIVTGKATPVHVGRSTQVWEITITDEEDRLVNVSRLTMAIVEKRDKNG